ncbi:MULTISPECIES: flippase [unclassified Guyparkeria]|uniref:flippase n=1 Tax=unclassified Guyparkeria TaxID=2626246 RepID=UPI0007339A34|nr:MULTISPECIES: flippase [unclassified Guyparkeria]KTG16290.1 hypothetical protein AUR63_05545 [Guyparkeria sp. XI15]OAE85141.1 hypothetical protein AWR35_05555 [Guyparkeria sp. WRN-7]
MSDPRHRPGLFHAGLASLKGEGLRAQLLRGGLGTMGLRLFGLALSLAIAVILARALGPAGFGVYSFVLTVMTVLALPARFGMPNLLVRETARAQSAGDWPMIRGLWRWSLRLLALTSIVIVLITGVVLIGLTGHSQLVAEQRDVFLVGLVLVPLMGIAALRGAQLRGLRHVLSGQMPELLVRPLVFIGLLGGLWWLWPVVEISPVAAILFNAIALLAAFITGSWLVRRYRPGPLQRPGETSMQQRAWLAATLPLALTEGVNLINQHVDILMLGVMGSTEEVGIYRVVVHGATLVAFGLAAVNMVVAPHFARLHAQGDMATLQRLITRSAQAVVLLALPAVLVFVAFGRELIGWVFGQDFVGGYWPLVILAGGQLVNALVGSVAVLLNMTGHERDVTRGVALGAILNVVLNLALIPSFGMVGAAIASTSSLVVWNLILWRVVHRRLGLESSALGMQRR